MTTRDDDLRREGAADAVLRIVAAKTLLAPFARADDVARAVGVTRGDLRAALDRLRGVYRPLPPLHPVVVPNSELDAFVIAALESCAEAAPAKILGILHRWGAEFSVAGVYDALARLVAFGVLERPRQGMYRLVMKRQAS